MGKKRSAKVSSPKPTESYQQTVAKHVAQQVNDKLIESVNTLIIGQCNHMQRQIQANMLQEMSNIFTRISALEDFFKYKMNMTDKEYAQAVAEFQDKAEGYVTKVSEDDIVDMGDRVRISIKSKNVKESKDKEEPVFDDQGKTIIDNVGAGTVLQVELEEHLIGMKVGETKTVDFGPLKQSTVKLTVDVISAKKEEELKEEEVKTDDKDA